MDGKKSLTQKIGNKFVKAKSKLINKLQKSYSDWHVDTSTSTGATSKYLNSPFLPVSQPQNLESTTLIWYDPRLDTNEDTKKTAQELREINNYIIFYSDQSECIDYIKSINDEKIFLITSGKCSSDILTEINELSQIDSIFIFCFKVEKYQNLLEKYKKIVGIYCERSTLIDSIKQNVELLQKQLDTFSVYNKHREKATRDLSEEAAEFLWFQMFKDVILRISGDNHAKQELIQFCSHYYRGNQKELDFINEFERDYKSNKSIYWYTRQTFLYKMVNKALRTEDIGQLYIFRFFIADLSLNLAAMHKKHRELEELIMLYRGLQLNIEELNVLKQNEGCLISTNGFLSTSRSKDVAVRFARGSTKRTNVIPILYEIECNVNELESTVFADITKCSKYATEQEVLFDLGSTFQIISVNEDTTLNLYVVQMKATDAGIETVKEYIELNRKDNEQTSSVIMFGSLLVQMGKYDEALKYFTNLLNDLHGKEDIARILNEIGAAHMFKGELDKADENFRRAYEMMMHAKPPRVNDSARPLINIASVFLQRGKYDKSLIFYVQALQIRRRFYGIDHLYTAITLNNIGNVYYKKEDYSKALMYHEATLEIRQSQLPHDHIDIAASLNNIGLVYWKMNDFHRAHDYYERSLAMRKKLLPPEHNSIIQSLINIAHLFYDQSDLNTALKYYSEALTIQKTDFDPTDHHDLVGRLNENRQLQNCARITRPEYAVLDSISKSEGTCLTSRVAWPEFAMEMSVCSLKHSTTASSLVKNVSSVDDIIDALKNDTDHQIAFNLWKQKLNQYEEFDENHPYVQGLLWIMGDAIMHFCTSDGTGKEDLRFYEKALFLLENSVPQLTDTENISLFCLERLALIHDQNSNYELALDSYTKTLKIQQQLQNSLTEIASTLYHIGKVYMKLRNYNLALTSFNDAQELLQSNSIDPSDFNVRFYLELIGQSKNVIKSATHS